MRKLVVFAIVPALVATAWAAAAQAADIPALVARMKGVDISRLSDAEKQAMSVSLTETWRELAAAGKPAAAEIRKQLEAHPRDAYFQLSASMVLYQIEPKTASPAILTALERTSISDNAFQYFYLCHRLARQREPGILPVLRRLLANERTVVFIDHESPMLEPRTICTYLYGVYGTAAVRPLMQACTDPNAVVRANAASMLGFFGDETPMFVLADLLALDADEQVRAAAANALGQMDHYGVIRSLSHALNTDQSASVRAACAFALGEVQHELCIEPLALAVNDLSPQVRQYAIDSLEHVGHERGSEFIANRLAIETDPAVRLALIRALGMLGHEKSVAVLNALRKNPEESKAAADAIRRIQAIGPPAREPYPGMKGEKVSAKELAKLIASLMEKNAAGIEAAKKTIFLSAEKDDIAKLEELRSRALWSVTNETMDRVSETGKLIRLVKRRIRGMM